MPVATLVTTAAAHPAGVPAADPTTAGEIVSTTVRFSIVAPPVFVTAIEYVIGDPGHGLPVTVFCTETDNTGAGTANPVPFVSRTVVVHAPLPATYAVFVTAVVPHTGPTTPVIVNVHDAPSPRFVAAVPLHTNRVPDPATLTTVGVGNPLGSLAVALVTTGEIVSTTTRFVIVIVPVFTTTTLYVTGPPIPGDAGACSFDTVRPVTGADSTTPTGLVTSTVVEPALDAITNPVFDTAVSTHTTPYWPEIVNVVVVPGRKLSPVPVHSNRVPLPTLVTTAAGQPAGVTATDPTTTGEIVSSTVSAVIVAPPVFVTAIEYVTMDPGHGLPVIVFCTCTARTVGRSTVVTTVELPATATGTPHDVVPATVIVNVTGPPPVAV